MRSNSNISNLADRLREGDEAVWRQVEDDVVPRVLAALRRRFGPGLRWHDLEGFARSAQRVACQRLQARDNSRLEEVETLDQLTDWLVVAAARKFKDALRRSGHEMAQARAHAELADASRHAAQALVADLEACLEDPTDQTVFRGKLEGRNEAEIAMQLGCSRRKVRGIWARLRRRLAEGN